MRIMAGLASRILLLASVFAAVQCSGMNIALRTAMWAGANTQREEEVDVLADALDAPGLAFTTGGDDEWTAQSETAHRGGSALKSGAIGDNQETWVETSVTGAGEVSFWWKASSERYKQYAIDYAVFSVDGVERLRIGGEIDWRGETVEITGGGVHTLRWAYVKDSQDSSGSDCAWLDEVTWTPNAVIPVIAADAAPEAVANAVETAGFADADVKGVIGGSAAEYNAFKTWAASVMRTAGSASPATAAGEEAVVANTNAAAAYLLGAERLFENAPTVAIEEVSLGDSDEMGGGVGANGSTMTLAVTVKDGEVPVSCVAAKVKALFEATSDLGDWTGAAKLTPTVNVEAGEGATMRFTVTPGDGTQPRAFLRIHK